MAADVCITEYTDPGCPWAYSAEPFRRRLSWLYGARLEWRLRMVGLAESPEEYVDRGFTPERQSSAFSTIAREHGMPIDTSVRPRMAATVPACRAVVAAKLHAPARAPPPSPPPRPPPPPPPAACCAAGASATSPASCSTSRRRSPAPRRTRGST